MSIHFSIQTRRGGRKKNEDRADHVQTDSCSFFILADGMGGHPDGEIAAEIAIRTMTEVFHKETNHSILQDPKDFLQKGFRAAHYRIIRYGTEQGLLDVPRTTAVACVIQNGMIWWGNCGDSRLYLVRDYALLAHTADHSIVKGGERNLDFGKTPQELSEIGRSALYSCLGGMILPEVDVTGPIVLRPRDRVLLCSDGLWSALTQEKVIALLSTNIDIIEVATNLVESALHAAGKSSDNVTVIAVEWDTNNQSAVKPQNKKQTVASFDNVFSDNDDMKAAIDGIKHEMDELIKRLTE